MFCLLVPHVASQELFFVYSCASHLFVDEDMSSTCPVYPFHAHAILLCVASTYPFVLHILIIHHYQKIDTQIWIFQCVLPNILKKDNELPSEV